MCVLGVKRKTNFLKSKEKDPDMWRRELKAFLPNRRERDVVNTATETAYAEQTGDDG